MQHTKATVVSKLINSLSPLERLHAPWLRSIMRQAEIPLGLARKRMIRALFLVLLFTSSV